MGLAKLDTSDVFFPHLLFVLNGRIAFRALFDIQLESLGCDGLVFFFLRVEKYKVNLRHLEFAYFPWHQCVIKGDASRYAVFCDGRFVDDLRRIAVESIWKNQVGRSNQFQVARSRNGYAEGGQIVCAQICSSHLRFDLEVANTARKT